MQHVNIYVESTWRGPRHTSGVYEFIMEVYMQPGQDPVTLTKHTELEDRHHTYQQCMRDDIRRLHLKLNEKHHAG